MYLYFSGLCLYSANGIKDQFAEANLTIMQSIAYPPNTVITNDVMDDYLSIMKQTSRSKTYLKRTVVFISFVFLQTFSYLIFFCKYEIYRST